MNSWDKIYIKKGKDYTSPVNKIPKLVKLFKKYNVKRVLDLGCGGGEHILLLANKNFDVYGIDISKEGIKIARKRLKAKGHKVHLKIGSIYEKLPYKNNFFNAVISLRTIHHARARKIRFLIEEIKRILKPGGLIFITVPKVNISKKPKIPIKLIEPRTYLNLGGEEKGVTHYTYNKELLKKHFKNFKILKLHVNSNNYYCLLGVLA